MEWEKAYKSLLGCMIGTISNLDLYYIKKQIDILPNKDLEAYYEISIEAHCSMAIFEDQEIA